MKKIQYTVRKNKNNNRIITFSDETMHLFKTSDAAVILDFIALFVLKMKKTFNSEIFINYEQSLYLSELLERYNKNKNNKNTNEEISYLFTKEMFLCGVKDNLDALSAESIWASIFYFYSLTI